MNIYELSPIQLRQAATLKERIAKLQKELNSIFGTATTTPATAGSPKKQMMSPAVKAKLSAKLKAYWAKRKGAKTSKVVLPPSLPLKPFRVPRPHPGRSGN